MWKGEGKANKGRGEETEEGGRTKLKEGWKYERRVWEGERKLNKRAWEGGRGGE